MQKGRLAPAQYKALLKQPYTEAARERSSKRPFSSASCRVSVNRMAVVWEKSTRIAVWKALQLDDPDLLEPHIRTSQDVRDASTALWNPEKYSKNPIEGKKDVSLLDVMLMQRNGVNADQGGAMRCWEWIEARFPDAYTDEEKQYAWQRRVQNSTQSAPAEEGRL